MQPLPADAAAHQQPHSTLRGRAVSTMTLLSFAVSRCRAQLQTEGEIVALPDGRLCHRPVRIFQENKSVVTSRRNPLRRRPILAP